ncbi:hypothetical protein E3V39_00160 [Gammaproteobacteria bacterium LSUCC0112]|nr:hypothetical protein E3V39_00160 [Gammaproteobacteria bacterium LSUCC0112]
MPRPWTLASAVLLLGASLISMTGVHAQDFPDTINLDDSFEAVFDDPLDDPSDAPFTDPFAAAFDDKNLFDNAGSSAPSHFRFRLSHQLSGHLNRHSTPTPLGTREQRTRGIENQRLGMNIRYQNPFASGWLLQGSAQIRAWLPGDYEYNNPERDDAEWRINELYVQRSGARDSFSFGRQTIVWGETLGNSVLDVINTTEYRDLSIIDIEDARLNQWLLVWDRFGDNGNWSSFINLYPEFDPTPITGSPLFPRAPSVGGQTLRLGYHHRESSLFEVGTRWNRSFSGSDVAVMAARLYENPLRYTLALPDPTLPALAFAAQSTINDYTLLGLSANRAMGRLLLTLDVAFSQGVLIDSVNNLELPGGGSIPAPAFERRNRLGVSAGLEYGISPTQQISVSASAQQDRGLDQDARGNFLLRYSNNLRNDDLVLSATLQSQLDGEAVLMFLGADYRLNDDWEINGQLVLTRIGTQSPLYFLDEDVRAGVTVVWNF